jgi:DedD protein
MLDTRVKQRLTGAIILVALLVLLVPELLTGPSLSASSAQTPANGEDAQLRSYKIELNDTPRSGAPQAVDTPVPESQPAQSSGAAQASGPADVEAGNAAATQPESVDSSPERTARAAQSGAAGAASAEPEKAPAPLTASPPAPRVEAAKPPPPVRVTETAKPSPPVRVAEAAKRSGSAEPRPAAGWAWQVGSFASRENAERLTRELKGKGFAATVSESSGKGKRLWRVRVGPEQDRAAAVALGAKLRGAGHPGGAPVPYP